MPFTYQAGAWVPYTSAQHSAQALIDINATLAALAVQDSKGNPMVLQPIASNAAWIYCLALGAMRAADDDVLLSASQMFSIALCSNAQLLELLPIIGTDLIAAQFSLITLHVVADSGGTATVSAGSKAPFGSICNFVTLATAVIPASGSADILAQADVAGPIAVAPGSLTAFSATIPHVSTVTNPAAAVTGTNPETYPQLRQRVLSGDVVKFGQDGVSLSLKQVQGITRSQVYFNPSPSANLTLVGGTVIPPRTSYLVIEGADLTGSAIAAAYWAGMNSPTLPFGTTTYTRTDISFSSTDNSINTAAGNFLTAGFAVGQFISVAGSAANNFTGAVGQSPVIASVTATKIIVSGVAITTEGAGASDVLTVLPGQALTTLSGQVIPIYYRVAPLQQVYVQVKYDPTVPVTSGFVSAIQAIVSAIALEIGEPLVAAAVDQALAGFAFARITGSQVSLTGTSGPWSNEAAVNGDSLAQVQAANVIVVSGP